MVVSMTSPDPTTPQTPPEPPGPRRLTRSSTDSVLGGVGGGLGRYFGVDPILFRIGFAVAAFAGGAGLLAYFALWLLVPDENGEGAKRPEGRELALIAGGGALLLLLFGVFGAAGDFFIWPGFVGLLVLGLLVAAVVSADRGGNTGNRLLRAVIVFAAVIAAGIAGFAAAIGTAFGGGAIVAGIVILCGLGLIAGAFGPGRRWLLIPALVLAVPAAVGQAADLRVEGGVGEREYRPLTDADLPAVYELGAGDMTIDMTDYDFPSGRTGIRIDMGIGEVRVIVPEDVCLSWRTDVGAGEVEVFDRENGGVEFDWAQSARGEGDSPELFVDADIDFGAIEIGHPSDIRFDREHDHGPFDRWDEDDSGRVEQAACE